MSNPKRVISRTVVLIHWPPTPPPDFTAKDKERYALFTATYLPQYEVHVPESKEVIPVSPVGQPRRCRFCGGTTDDVVRGHAVMFEQFVHLIPEQLGNRTQGFDAECDACNARHGTYESDLGAYTLPLRAALGVRRKKAGYPTYKGPEIDGVTSLRVERIGDQFRVIAPEGSGTCTFDLESKELTLRMIRGPFRPLHVYKALAKVAVALLEEDEVDDYGHYLDLLSSDEHDGRFEGHPAASLFGYWFPGWWGVRHPSATLWRRKPAVESTAPSKVLILRFVNQLWQIPIFSLADHDAWVRQTGSGGTTTITVPQHPAPIPAHVVERYGPYGAFSDSLSSADMRRGDEFTTTFGYREARPIDATDLT